MPHAWDVDYSGDCSEPILLERIGYPLQGRAKSVYGLAGKVPLSAFICVPCRKCENCLGRRCHHWRLRAMSETKAAVRTWFGTLTLSPDQHSRVAMACRVEASRNGDDWDTFDQERQFALRHKCISREITLYLKRIRKRGGEGARFVCVAEAHKSGLPHYHMLVHEGDQTALTWRILTEEWRVGFCQWKLVKDTRAAGYVTKYLSKDALARVRASVGYGKETSLDIETLQKRSRAPLTSTSHTLVG